MNFFEEVDRLLTDSEHALVDKARTFCAGEFSGSVHRAFCDGVPYPERWIEEWANLGLLGLQVKPEDGGYGASYICKIRIAQEMAMHGFAAAFSINNLQGSVTRLSQSGTPAQRENFLPGLMRGTTLCAPAFTEPAGGSDLGALKTTATPVAGGWLLNGTKAWITNGTIVDLCSLLARVEGIAQEDNIANFLVDCRSVETVERKELVVHGARSFRLAQISFTNHFVPDWAMFAKPGEAFKTSMKSINAARVHVAAMCVASLYGALCEAIEYCDGRQSFGKSLLKHQGLRWELAEVAIRLEAANSLVCRAVRHIAEGDPILTLAAQAKKFAVDTAIWGIDQCARAMGAIGPSDAARLGMQQMEVRMSAYGDGTNEILLDRVGGSLGKDYLRRSRAQIV